MNALTIIYWTRVLLGIVAALLCTLFNELVGGISILNGISIALLVYIITYYVYKARFLTKVEKRSKLLSTGVGAYFFTWIVVFALLFTLVSPTLTITSPARGATFTSGDTIAIVAEIASPFGVSFTGANVTTTSPNSTLIQLIETSAGTYSATYPVNSTTPTGKWNIRIQAVANGRYREATVTVNIQTNP
jgi:hypothetical protein